MHPQSIWFSSCQSLDQTAKETKESLDRSAKETRESLDRSAKENKETAKETRESLDQSAKENKETAKETRESLDRSAKETKESLEKVLSIVSVATFGMVILILMLAIYTAVANGIGKPDFLGYLLIVIFNSAFAVMVGAAFAKFSPKWW